MTAFELLEVVALARDMPDDHLTAGDLGTIVEFWDPSAFIVEFVEDSGHTTALLTLRASDVRKLTQDELEASEMPLDDS